MACCTTSRTYRGTLHRHGSFTDHRVWLDAFAGIRLAPRIRDLGETKLFIPKGDAAYDAPADD